jgi:hypothetical protein
VIVSGNTEENMDTETLCGIIVENVHLEMKKMENIKICVTEVDFENNRIGEFDLSGSATTVLSSQTGINNRGKDTLFCVETKDTFIS